MARSEPVIAEVAGRRLTLTNLTKLYWPEDGITKAELIAYYTEVAPFLLPHLKDRPLVMTRYPDGIHGKWFYHKDAPPGTPDWMQTWATPAEDDRVLHYLIPQEPAILPFVANLGAIEIHPWLSRHQHPNNPDWSVIDLDPSEGATFDEVLLLARLVGQVLDAIGVKGYPKLSGATGIHIYCPCTPDHTYAETAAFAEAVGRVLLKVHPATVTLERVVAKRGSKVYIDYLQNRRGQTITAVYGVRPKPGAPVSAPVTWEEINSTPPRFSIRTIRQRLAEVGDLFAPLLNHPPQDLRRAAAALS